MRALVLVVVACGGAQVAPSAPAALVVLDAGAEPRQLLRREPTGSERMETTVKVRGKTAFTNTVLEDGERSFDAPSLVFVSRLTATGRDAAGVTTVAYEIESARILDDTVDPAMIELEARRAKLTGIRGTWRLAANGTISDVVLENVDAPPERFQTLRDSIVTSGARFPDVPVGVGATWRVTSNVRFANFTWERVETFRLRALTDAAATVEISTAMRAGEQALVVEPNRSQTLLGATSTETGELVIPLRGLVVTSTLHDEGEYRYRIVQKARRISTRQQNEVLFSTKRLD